MAVGELGREGVLESCDRGDEGVETERGEDSGLDAAEAGGRSIVAGATVLLAVALASSAAAAGIAGGRSNVERLARMTQGEKKAQGRREKEGAAVIVH